MASPESLLYSCLDRVTLILIREFNKHIPGQGFDIRSEVVRLGDGLARDVSYTPALVTQISGPGGLIEFVQQPRLGYTPPASSTGPHKQGIVPAAPMDVFSFTVCPSISFWTNNTGEGDVLGIRGGRIVPEDIDIAEARSDPSVNRRVNQYVKQLVNELMDAAHGKPNRFNGWRAGHAEPGVQGFLNYPYSLTIDPGLTGRVIRAFNRLLPVEGIGAESNVNYFPHPEDGMPKLTTVLSGKGGAIHIWQMYVATLAEQAEAHKAEKIDCFPVGSLRIATFPHIFFKRTAGDQSTVYVDPSWDGPVTKVSSSTLCFPNYAVMAKQLLTYACGGRPKPADVQLSLALA